jgi:hypothetical protein
LWSDPLADFAPREFELVPLPNGEGGVFNVKQKALPVPKWPSSTLQAVQIQHSRVQKYGGGDQGTLQAMKEIHLALDRQIATLQKQADKEKANPSPPRPAPPAPPPKKEPPELIPTRDLPAGSVSTITLWPPWPGAYCRLVLAIVEAAALPEALRAKLGLEDAEYYVPTEGAANGKRCVIFGECKVVTQIPMLYGPEDTYLLSEAVRLTRAFSKPRVQADLVEQRRLGIEAERAERLAAENRRLEENRRNEEARLEAARKASPLARIKDLEKRLNEALGETPPPEGS